MANTNKKFDLASLPPEHDSQISGLLAEVGGKTSERIPARIVSVPLSQVIPDRFHARMILPKEIKRQFFTNEIDCYEAAKMLLEAARDDAFLRLQVEDLLVLGQSMLDNFQIQPATGYWARNESGSYYLFLEVGTRRFWALVLRYVEKNLSEEPVIEVAEVTESGGFRQIAENVHTQYLCAVELAKSVATLILLRQNVLPEPTIENENDYFRQALALKRITKTTWSAIARILNRPPDVLKQHLRFLTLSDSFLYQAALHRLPAHVLDEIINVPKENQADMLSAALDKTRLFLDDATAKSTLSRKQSTKSENGANSSRSETLANYIINWFEVAEKTNKPGEFLDVAEDLSARMKTSEEMDLLARRLTNLARDVRVVKTRRLFS